MADHMRLLGFLMHTPINHLSLSWADEEDRRLSELSSFKPWQSLARKLEEYCFDGLFFADVPAPYDFYHDRTDEAVKYGVCWPSHDPVALLGAMASVTDHLGYAVTLSVAGIPPFLAVRTLSTLDYLSQGRIGWNIVTGNGRAEHRALGTEPLEHDARYDRADEYLRICYALWDGIGEKAIIADRNNGIYADPARVEKIDFEGKYLRCRATPSVLPSAQRRPVLFQAGSSGRGQAFAAKHSDVIFGIQSTIPAMKDFQASVKAASIAEGRNKPCQVLYAIQPYLGGTEEEAKRRREELLRRIPIDAALCRLSGTLGIDFGQMDLDLPLEELPTQASRGMMAAVSKIASEKRWTIREAIVATGTLGSIPSIVGTPQQVADQLETMWRESGCRGFNITPPISPKGLIDFAEQVVPLLQNRGVFRQEYSGRTFSENLLQ
jgi:FMN-dependent oxidoreductase (nitrilotriacetate monooxygenase family)